MLILSERFSLHTDREVIPEICKQNANTLKPQVGIAFEWFRTPFMTTMIVSLNLTMLCPWEKCLGKFTLLGCKLVEELQYILLAAVSVALKWV